MIRSRDMGTEFILLKEGTLIMNIGDYILSTINQLHVLMEDGGCQEFGKGPNVPIYLTCLEFTFARKNVQISHAI